MNTFGKISGLISLCAIASVAACSSDDDGDAGGGAFDSGVEAGKPGEDLTQEEAEAICQAQSDYAESKISDDAFARAACHLLAISVAVMESDVASESDPEALRQICETVDETCQECIDDPDGADCEPYEGVGELDNDCSDAEVAGDCSSTVGEIEACLKAQSDAFLGMLDDLPSCDEMSEDTEAPDLQPEVGECQIVEDNCPEALE